jgi:hypothetical protein
MAFTVISNSFKDGEKRNDVEAELVATIGRPVMRPQRLLAALWPRNRSSITETGATLTRLFGFQFRLNARAEAVAHESPPYDDRDFGS